MKQIDGFRQKNKDVREASKQKPMAKSAEAKTGQLVFIKQEGTKAARRDIYLVIEVDDDDNTVTVCKMRHLLSNDMTSIQPHDPRYRYRVRQ